MVKKENKNMIIILVIIGAFIVFNQGGSFLGAVAEETWYPKGYDMKDIDLSQLSQQTYGENLAVSFRIRSTGTTSSADRGWKHLDYNKYFDGMDTSPGGGKVFFLEICDLNEPTSLNINKGENITLKFYWSYTPSHGGETQEETNYYTFYLPELKGDIQKYQGLDCVNLYLGKEGKTYWNQAFTSLAGEKPASATCTPSWSCRPWSDSTNECGSRICEDANSCEEDYVETKDCQTGPTCTDLRATLDSDISKWLSGTFSRDALGVSINNWVTC